MKDIIIPVLNELKASLDNKDFKGQKTITKSVNLNNYTLSSLDAYVKENDIKEGVFCTEGDYNSDPIYCWNVKTDFTDRELVYKRERLFNSTSFKKIYDAMINAGYKRIGLDSIKYRPFINDTVYSMYVSGDYDRLVSYYSLFFSKE